LGPSIAALSGLRDDAARADPDAAISRRSQRADPSATVLFRMWMRLLTVAFGSPAEFLACYSTRLSAGALFCPTRASFRVGEDLYLEVGFPGLPNRSILRGQAHTASSGLGGWVGLDPSEARTRDFLVGCARGEAPDEPIERGHVRIPAALPVDCRIDELDEPSSGERLVGETQDVGGGGVFIRSTQPPAVGTRVQLVLGPTSDSGTCFALDGRVAWIGSQGGGRGFAVRFDRGGGDAQRLRTMLRRAWETGRVAFAR
jgi:Tfp pilus assembly protein PilZ